jgi:hypothetical protein
MDSEKIDIAERGNVELLKEPKIPQPFAYVSWLQIASFVGFGKI